MNLIPAPHLIHEFERAFNHITQADKPFGDRSLTARAYGSALNALRDYLSHLGVSVPDRIVLEQWRDEMLAAGLTTRTVNMRLSAVRKWLRLTADLTTDITAKLVIRDYANVENAKIITIQDKTESDYGIRLELTQLSELMNLMSSNVKGLRDKALVALMAGAGLRVGEATTLTVEDALHVTDSAGIHGIRIRHGKHGKSRIAVIGCRDHWVFRCLDEYLDAAPPKGVTLIRGVAHLPDDRLVSTSSPISTRAVALMMKGYPIPSLGNPVTAHDLRRTYGYLCNRHGMAWDALRSNMGHSSLRVTEAYVGHAVKWGDRVVSWQLD